MLRDARLLDPAPPDADPPEPPPRTPGVPRALVTASELSWRALACAGGVALLVFVLWQIRFILVPVVIAVLLATVLVPPVQRLQRMGVSRRSATTTVFLTALAALFVIGA